MDLILASKYEIFRKVIDVGLLDEALSRDSPVIFIELIGLADPFRKSMGIDSDIENQAQSS